MKKLIAITLLFASLVASAQINIKNDVPEFTYIGVWVDVPVLRESASGISEQSGMFSLAELDTLGVFLVAESSNRYDDRFVISLGNTKDAVSQSLKDIYACYDLPENKHFQIPMFGDAQKFYDAYVLTPAHVALLVTTPAKPSKKSIHITGDGYGGQCWISRRQFEKLMDKWDEYKIAH